MPHITSGRQGSRHRWIALALIGSAIGGVACAGPSQDAAVAEGTALYDQYCANCHGLQGDGQGDAAYLVFPKPRNFQRAEFKLRSTPQGMLPTDADLARTVSEGIPGTSMFSFANVLDETEIAAVVEQVKALSPPFADAAPISEELLLDIPPPPPRSEELVALGRETYRTMGCGQCHGPEGRGDGPASPTLRDSEGAPFPAADFTYGVFKSGGDPEGLYRTFLTGMAGTPMPSFAAAFTSERQAWGLVYYTLSLSDGRAERPVRTEPGPLVAAPIEAVALDDPWSRAWESATPHRVVLRPLWYRNDFVPYADVRVGRSGQEIAVLVEWSDDSRDAEALRTESFADGVALQLSPAERPPFIGMGRPQAGGAVEIWYWRADRQAVHDGDGPVEGADVYPRLTVDAYPYGAGERADDPLVSRGGPYGDQPDPFVPGRDVGNPMSTPDMLGRPVHHLRAAGFGSLTERSPDARRASGQGAWGDGRYRVLFRATASPADPDMDTDLRSGLVWVAIAVWDGSAGDRNGTKLVSQWIRIDLGGATAVEE